MQADKVGRTTVAAQARRVLLLLEDLGGGTGNHVCLMVRAWRALGWQVTVVTQTPPLVHQMPPDIDVRVIDRAGWYDHFPFAQLRRLLVLGRLIRALQPDVVHTYFFWSILYGRLLKLLGLVPLLVENREDMGFSWGRNTYRALRLTRSLPDRIVCVAEAVRQVAIAREGADPARTIVVRNGIPADRPASVSREAARWQLGLDEGQVVVGMVANLPRAVKGGHRLFDMIGAILADAPEVRFLLVGLGTEPETLGRELHARGITGGVVGTGYRTDVETCYAAMDISVLTSSSEGLSVTLLESMRAGLPTIVTRVGGNAEVVVDGVTGYLVPIDEPDAFVSRVVEVARDPSLRRQMGDAGRRRVVEHFSIEDVGRRYVELYNELVRTAGRGRRPVRRRPLVSEMKS